MRKIGIVSLGYAWLPCEPGPSRFYDIARMFAEHGYEVDLIGSSFQHYEKKPKNKILIKEQNYPFHNTFIEVPAYKKNIDLRRVYSNMIAGKRVIEHLEQNTYDVIYCSIPANNVAAKVGEYCRKRNIPFIVDIEDLWPEAMEMVFRVPVLKDILFYPFKRDAERTYACADAVIGTSREYTNRVFLNQKREILHKTVYVGCDLSVFDDGIQMHKQEITKGEEEFWVSYAGSIGTSYDIRTLVLAGEELRKQKRDNIKIKIMGTGPLKDELETLAKELHCDNVEFLGYVDYKRMAANLSISDVLINSFVKGAPQSIVNKVGDYLAAGKPMLNTLESNEFMELVETQDFGTNVEPENVQALVDVILEYYKDSEKCKLQGEQARKTAEEFFDRNHSYLGMIEIADDLVDKK